MRCPMCQFSITNPAFTVCVTAMRLFDHLSNVAQQLRRRRLPLLRHADGCAASFERLP